MEEQWKIPVIVDFNHKRFIQFIIDNPSVLRIISGMLKCNVHLVLGNQEYIIEYKGLKQ